MSQEDDIATNTAYVFLRPTTMTTIGKAIIIKNKDQYAQLISEAKSKKLYLASTEFVKRDNKFYQSTLIIDWNSIPDKDNMKEYKPTKIQSSYDRSHIENSKLAKKPESTSEKLLCPYCNKTMTSTSGRTLHIKSKHPEKLESQ